MCGIAGIFRRDGAAPEPVRIAAMTRSLAHRGPDGEGVWQQGPVALGHRRLALRDLTDAGAQPMTEQSGDVTISFNGEIYNDTELRRELQLDFGFQFNSRCDAEVIPYGYLAWGDALFERLEGMFAIGLWDRRCNTLVLARDRMGLKPLFYSVDNSEAVFASEMKAIDAVRAGERSICPDALHVFLANGHCGPERTLRPNVQQVPPGTIIRINANGLDQQRYWAPYRAPAQMTETDAVRECERVVRVAVGDWTASDVPLGVLQSGGIDSALVSFFASERTKENITLFTARFDQQSYDESVAASSIAKQINATHRLVSADPVQRAEDIFREMIRHTDCQCVDTGSLPYFLLAEAVSSETKAVLSGDGGDELFGGYETYRATLIANAARWMSPAAAIAGSKLYDLAPLDGRRPSLQAKLSRLFLGMGEGGKDAHVQWRRLVPGFMLEDLYGPVLQPYLKVDPFDEYVSAFNEAGGGLLDRAMIADQKWHLPSVLSKVDMMSMAHGLEVRPPLLDSRVIDFAASCPMSLLSPLVGRQKRILRLAAEATKINRTFVKAPKRGFNAPLAALFRTTLKSLGNVILDDEADALSDFFQPETLRRIWREHRDRKRDHAYAIWPMLCFGVWLRDGGVER